MSYDTLSEVGAMQHALKNMTTDGVQTFFEIVQENLDEREGTELALEVLAGRLGTAKVGRLLLLLCDLIDDCQDDCEGFVDDDCDCEGDIEYVNMRSFVEDCEEFAREVGLWSGLGQFNPNRFTCGDRMDIRRALEGAGVAK